MNATTVRASAVAHDVSRSRSSVVSRTRGIGERRFGILAQVKELLAKGQVHTFSSASTWAE